MKFFTVNNKKYSKIISPYCDLENGPWVAGGSVRKIWEGKPWQNQDIDFFFKNPNQYSRLRERIGEFGQLNNSVYETQNASSFTININPIADKRLRHEFDLLEDKLPKEDLIKIQLICKQWYTSALDVINNFDLGISQFITDGNTIIASDQAVQDHADRAIRVGKNYLGKINPLRVVKYAAYGYDPDPDLFLSCLQTAIQDGVNDDSY